MTQRIMPTRFSNRTYRPMCILLCALCACVISSDDFCSFAAAEELPQVQEGNLVAWCIVPFDASQRTPDERARMLRGLGIEKLAYDWRDEHVASFEAEVIACRKHGIEFFAFWGWHDAIVPVLRRHDLHPQFWVMLPPATEVTEEQRIESAVSWLLPRVKQCQQLGSLLGIYNHGGWQGEPANMCEICRRVRERSDYEGVGVVYNLHHAHHRIDSLEEDLRQMAPYLLCLNLNGTMRSGSPKIVPIGAGDADEAWIKSVQRSGYQGPIGIIDHRSDVDAEKSLRENLDGLKQLIAGPQNAASSAGGESQ